MSIAGLRSDAVTSASLRDNPQLDDWIRIDHGETVTLCTGKAELGQGLIAAIARIGAEELDLSLERVRVQTADTASGPDEGLTAGSRSLPDSGTAIRRAAAEARAHLLELAAACLQSPIETLTVDDGTIRSATTGRRTTYWELLGGRRFNRRITGMVAPKSPDTYRVIGGAASRIDLPGLVFGSTRFVSDLDAPGMVHGRVVRPPSPGARLAAVELERTRGLDGVMATIRDGSFLGVIAEREEQAIRATDVLEASARWEEQETLPPNGDMATWLRGRPTESFLVVDGVPTEGLDTAIGEPPTDAAATVQATFTRPPLMHGSIGPSAAMAVWRGDELTVWSHSQGVSLLRQTLAQALRIPPDRVRVVHVAGPGCYGHNGADDAALDGALLAAHAGGRPVLLKWNRRDEHTWEPYGPAMSISVRASADHRGQVMDWSSDIWSTSHNSRPFPGRDTSGLLAAQHRERSLSAPPPRPSLNQMGGIHRNAEPLYRVGHRRVVKRFVTDMPLRTSSLRALGAHMNVFAIESAIDELAVALDVDPLTMRLNHLDDDRARAVLWAAAERGGWETRSHEDGRGMGLGFGRYKNTECYAAVLVECLVHDETSQIKLERAVIAADAGQVVDPAGLINQLEGGLVQAASWTLMERVRFTRTRVTSVDWDTYPILRFSQVPKIETVLIDRPGEPYLGAGEATMGPTTAAIANAVFDAVGLRLRDLPFTPSRVQSAALA